MMAKIKTHGFRGAPFQDLNPDELKQLQRAFQASDGFVQLLFCRGGERNAEG